MKCISLLLLALVGTYTAACSSDPNERLHQAVSVYLQQKEPTYEPVSFGAPYRYTRKDSARFEWRKNGGLLEPTGLNQDSLEHQGMLLSIQDTTHVAQYILHVYKMHSKIDSARFVVFNTGEVWQIWPNPY